MQFPVTGCHLQFSQWVGSSVPLPSHVCEKITPLVSLEAELNRFLSLHEEGLWADS